MEARELNNKTMKTIKQIRDSKKIAEKSIVDLVLKFEKENNVLINRINFHYPNPDINHGRNRKDKFYINLSVSI